MTWLDNICIKKPHNCLKNHNCPNGSECCFERDTPSGKIGKQGTCVANGSCNYQTGHPTINTTNSCPTIQEGYKSGPGIGKHTNGINYVWYITIFVFLLVIFGLAIFVATNKK